MKLRTGWTRSIASITDFQLIVAPRQFSGVSDVLQESRRDAASKPNDLSGEVGAADSARDGNARRLLEWKEFRAEVFHKRLLCPHEVPADLGFFHGALELTARVVEIYVVLWERVWMQLAAAVAERQQLPCDASCEKLRQETLWQWPMIVVAQKQRTQQRYVLNVHLPVPHPQTSPQIPFWVVNWSHIKEGESVLKQKCLWFDCFLWRYLH